MYKYTLLKQDGTRITVTGEKKSLADIYELLGCRTVELIPMAYHPDEFANADIWGDEEARFNELNRRNPFMKVLDGYTESGESLEWDVVGDVLVEERI